LKKETIKPPKSIKYTNEKLLAKIIKMKATGDKKILKTWRRESAITSEMVGLTIAVHNGKTRIIDQLNVLHL
jgi:small subunit ribosomal protein S19